MCFSPLVGCGGRSTLDTAPVKGLVTLDGTPVAGATVTFMSTGPDGLSAVGRTDDKGIYTLTAIGGGESGEGEIGGGAMPGNYIVGIRKATATVGLSAEEADEQGVDYKPMQPGEAPTLQFLIPKKYQNPKDSGLTATVTDGDNDIPFELSSN
jgi:hypothetical protein